MIIYSKEYWGIHLILRVYGSAFPRIMLFSFISAGLTALLYYYPGRDYFYKIWGQHGHPYVYNNLGFIIGFILVFRSNFAYARFVTGRNQLQAMSAHWAYACSLALAFEGAETAAKLGRHHGNYEDLEGLVFPVHPQQFRDVDPNVFSSAIRRYEGFRAHLLHKFSLLHALCLQHLRGDWMLSNLKPHIPGDDPPTEDSAALGDQWWRLKRSFMLPASVKESMSYAEVLPIPVVPGIDKSDVGAGSMIKGGCITHDELISLGYKYEAIAEKQYETTFTGRDRSLGVGTLEKMRSMERDSYSTVVSRSDVSENGTIDTQVENDDFLEQKSPRSRVSNFFQQQTGVYVIGAQERVYTAFSWVQTLLSQRSDPNNGWKSVLTPTSATIFRSLSEGFEAFEQCRALVDTPFPFPWAQGMVVLLLIFTFTLPLLMVAWLEAVWLAVLLDFLSLVTFWSLNEVARDLESPFVFPPNDLPLSKMQHNFNERVLSAASAVFNEAIAKCN